MISGFFSSSLFWFSGLFFFFFPLVVFFLENFYFGRGCGLSHGCALTHVFCNLKPKSEANPNTAVTGNCLVLEMLSTHMHPPATVFCWFFFFFKVFCCCFSSDASRTGRTCREERARRISFLSLIGLFFKKTFGWYGTDQEGRVLPKYVAADLQLSSLQFYQTWRLDKRLQEDICVNTLCKYSIPQYS